MASRCDLKDDGLRSHSSVFTLCPQGRWSQGAQQCLHALPSRALRSGSRSLPPASSMMRYFKSCPDFSHLPLSRETADSMAGIRFQIQLCSPDRLFAASKLPQQQPPSQKTTINRKTKPTFLELCVLNIVSLHWVAGFPVGSLFIAIT